MKAEVMHMDGGRVDGYYYVGIEGTFLVACKEGHPDFPIQIVDTKRNAKHSAQFVADFINKQIEENIGTK